MMLFLQSSYLRRHSETQNNKWFRHLSPCQSSWFPQEENILDLIHRAGLWNWNDTAPDISVWRHCIYLTFQSTVICHFTTARAQLKTSFVLGRSSYQSRGRVWKMGGGDTEERYVKLEGDYSSGPRYSAVPCMCPLPPLRLKLH